MSFFNQQLKKCNIVIVDPQKGKTHMISIHSFHVKNLKYYITGIVLLWGILTYGCIYFYLSTEKGNIEKRKLASEVKKLQQFKPLSVDSLNAQDYIQRIDSKLGIINKYLKERGVKGFSADQVGGEENSDDLKMTPNEYYGMYYEYVEHVFEGLIDTPVGYPLKMEMTSNFGYRRNPFNGKGAGEFHPGIDFRGNKGDAVKCTAEGIVVFTGYNGGYGFCVQVKHKNNYETLYGHLSEILVKNGSKVIPGQVIGRVGSTGRSTGNHLHYEVRRNGKPTNPINFLNLD